MASLELKNVHKNYGAVSIIKGVDLSIHDGEFMVFVGPSGCGKSTLLRMIAGLEDISSGELWINDRKVNDLMPAERKIAMVFQSYALYPHLSVRKNLAFGLENLHFPQAEIAERINEAARMLGLEPYLDRKPRALSGGQQQRVAIGRAIVRDPDLFLFDEPLSNLDAKLRVQTRGELSRLHQKLRTTMIYVTHDQIEAMTMAQRIVVLNAGRIEQVGTPLTLFNRPKNKFVAGFIGSPRMNMFPAEIAETTAESAAVRCPSGNILTLPFIGRIGQKVTLGIRPSHCEIVPEGEGIALSVDRCEMMGHETFIYGRMHGIDEEMIVHLPEHREFAAGALVHVRFPAAYCHLFDADTDDALSRI
ncbi:MULTISPECIES: sn-glycerol-3-phosphate ABC transporter ATP-binding protein UgpC [unclassified Brenneria]|uniref:ABC transporter ATP-binding protein n=1 Tax=unclassified Brenneria TaxID=2634434 RepID=UPI0029C55698|nr:MULTISPECIES: sn-glycerol-3-phosphate ABC transporter ATP-binding protein UgpC [unclassified Brenneria]MDX5628728.1 sn-glycerol-3-phosphate ABC transporter ATP-binding protein UgpC [Brenneria sp. L3-3Z]MDX5695867.1 sn-glycerol-3-phosphate ABC transporter ATP-binding protein UgpC [Brenneria sp. L4-2C]MEE3661155.1 sn-glycerol-3-phosphate ABC transporter ATP-binding protein UgpC [Brenneria sp. g21c3]